MADVTVTNMHHRGIAIPDGPVVKSGATSEPFEEQVWEDAVKLNAAIKKFAEEKKLTVNKAEEPVVAKVRRKASKAEPEVKVEASV